MHIAVGEGKHLSKITSQVEEDWEDFCKRFKEPSVLKDKKLAGWFVAGSFSGNSRSGKNLISRSALCIDLEGPDDTKLERLKAKGVPMLIHSTYSHEPLLGEYRYHAIVPLKEDILPDEYENAVKEFCEGITDVDPRSMQEAQCLFFPSISNPDAAYELCIVPGENLYTINAQKTEKPPKKPRKNPKEISGTVGEFNRLYTVSEAIAMFLSDVYEREREGVYRYIPANSKGGLKVYDGDGYAYSNHSTDPTCDGHCKTAYDLVYIHKGSDIIVQAMAAEDFTAAPEKKKRAWLTLSQKGKADINTALLAAEIVEEELLFITSNANMFYDPSIGIWRKNAEEYLAQVALTKLGKHGKSHIVRDTVSQILDGQRKIDEDLPDTDIDMLVLKGGMYNIRQNEYYPEFDPWIYATTAHTIKYDPDAGAPLFEEYMASVYGADALPFIYEWLGFCFFRVYEPQKILFICGISRSGKSTTFEIFRHVIGEKSCSGVSLRSLKESEFAPINLFGKTANFDADAKREYLADADFLKALTGDMISANVKNKSPINFRNFAKLNFAMNELPSFRDSGGAFHERAVILSANAPVSKTQKLKTPIRKIKAEAPGIFNGAMEGLRRLLRTGEFTITDEMKERLEEYKRENNSVLRFVEDERPFEGVSFISSRDLYEKYQEYMADCGELKQAAGIDLFGKQLGRYGLKREMKVKKIDGKSVRGWIGDVTDGPVSGGVEEDFS